MAFCLVSCGGSALYARTTADLLHSFEHPADDARPMVRWWWFGPSVERGELDREIAAMRAGGFGGVEIQPTYPLSLDNAETGLRNLPYLSDDFLDSLSHTSRSLAAAGLRMDVTLGSGWPFGGPHVTVDNAAASIRMVRMTLLPGDGNIRLPAFGPGEKLLAAFVDGVRVANTDALPPSAQPRPVALFIAGRTGQQVKRPAIGAEGFVLDHVSTSAVSTHLRHVGDRLLTAFRDAPLPHAFFSDSLEAYGSSWTDDLPDIFRKLRGYDLIAHLPALFEDMPESAAVRYDWSRTLSELVDERYLMPITAWAKASRTRFRAQVYGFPPPTLSSNALVDLPEGEGADWRSFTSTRWASSGAHLYGKTVVSAETWTWLHSPSWAATPLDLKIEADRHFLQGVNQIVGHGWPYSPPGVKEPGWAFYAAAALNDHNPWYAVMPSVTKYLQRASALLREGEPDNGVAIYLPIEDAMADMTPVKASVNEEMRARLKPDIVGQVLEAGHGFDFIDAGAIRAGKLHHRLLVLPGVTRIDLDAYRAIRAWVAKGGKIVATGAPPSIGGGLHDASDNSRAVRLLSRRLFRPGSRHSAVVPPEALAATLRRLARGDVAMDQSAPDLGFVHRRLNDTHIYFLVNTGPQRLRTRARFAGDNGKGAWWDALAVDRAGAGTGDIAIDLAPYQSRFLVFGNDTPRLQIADADMRQVLDLSQGWVAKAEGDRGEPPLPGHSWTSDPAFVHYSGPVTYSRTIDLPEQPVAGKRLMLDLGDDRPVPTKSPNPDRPQAELDAPVRDAAIVRVNGTEFGAIWAPPWRLDVTPMLRQGANRIELVVMNSALNALAAQPPADLRLLSMRFGERFKNQDEQLIHARPAGLLGQIRLMSTAQE
jgi:hypothetical protein